MIEKGQNQKKNYSFDNKKNIESQSDEPGEINEQDYHLTQRNK